MNDYLMHHGVLGMKWGVRRYQNPDGSLTAAGKKRYSSKNKLAGGGRTSIYKNPDKQKDSSNSKKALATGVKIAAGLLLLYGGYKVVQGLNQTSYNRIVVDKMDSYYKKTGEKIGFDAAAKLVAEEFDIYPPAQTLSEQAIRIGKKAWSAYEKQVGRIYEKTFKDSVKTAESIKESAGQEAIFDLVDRAEKYHPGFTQMLYEQQKIASEVRDNPTDENRARLDSINKGIKDIIYIVKYT